jgi:hypothetical protein
MPVFETKARIGNIVSIDGISDMVYIIYPRFRFSLRRDEVIRLNLRAGNLRVMRIKNPASTYEGYDNVGQHPALNIRGRVTGFSAAKAGTSLNPTVYVNIYCTLEAVPEENETTLMLRLQHLQLLNLKQYDTFLISLSNV